MTNKTNIKSESNSRFTFDVESIENDVLIHYNVELPNMIMLKCHTIKHGNHDNHYTQSAFLLSTRNNESLDKYALVSVSRELPDHWGLTMIHIFSAGFIFGGVENFNKIPTLSEFKQFEIDSESDPFKKHQTIEHNISEGFNTSDDQIELINYEVFEDNLMLLDNEQ